MEYLDTYDENKNYLGKQTRDYVHENAIWHNTVHCWLYDELGNVYLQIRADEGTLYTTASGHVLAGETIKEAFGREIKEEIGINIDYENAILVDIIPFKLDKIKKDGSIFRDRAFSNVYICHYHNQISEFNFDENELQGLVKVNAKEALELFDNKKETINGTIITQENDTIISSEKQIKTTDFLVNKGETLQTKYGAILNKIIEVTKKN